MRPWHAIALTVVGAPLCGLLACGVGMGADGLVSSPDKPAVTVQSVAPVAPYQGVSPKPQPTPSDYNYEELESAAPQATTKKPRPKATTHKPKPKKTEALEPIYYSSCKAAKAAGVTPLYKGDPGYSRKLDRDGDGKACE